MTVPVRRARGKRCLADPSYRIAPSRLILPVSAPHDPLSFSLCVSLSVLVSVQAGARRGSCYFSQGRQRRRAARHHSRAHVGAGVSVHGARRKCAAVRPLPCTLPSLSLPLLLLSPPPSTTALDVTPRRAPLSLFSRFLSLSSVFHFQIHGHFSVPSSTRLAINQRGSVSCKGLRAGVLHYQMKKLSDGS